MTKELKRCGWSDSITLSDSLMRDYHDTEWGVPLHDDRKLFEFLVLEGMQAGLSWSTILNKRENFRKAFDGFDPAIVAQYGETERRRLLTDAGIVRNRQKIDAAINNAGCFLEVQKEFGSFDAYMWQFIGGKTICHRFKSLREMPASTPDSDRISKDLKRRGFKFVGSTIVYSHMQATGMVNDHIVDCFRYHEVLELSSPRNIRRIRRENFNRKG